MSEENKFLSLPAPSAPAEVAVERSTPYYSSPDLPESDQSTTPITHYLWLLNREKWKLLAFVAIVVAATVIVSSRMTPYYQSTATIDIDRMQRTGVVGQEAAVRPTVND